LYWRATNGGGARGGEDLARQLGPKSKRDGKKNNRERTRRGGCSGKPIAEARNFKSGGKQRLSGKQTHDGKENT